MYIFYKEITDISVIINMINKILWPLFAGFVLYSLIHLFTGPVGLSNMKRLDYFKVNLTEHVNDLNIKNVKLQDEIDRLNGDLDRLKQAARPLGYVEPGQKMIKILNNRVDNSLYNQDIQYQIPRFERNSNTILLVSALFTVILFVMSLLVGVISDTFKRK